MSLADCIRKAGKALDAKDIQGIRDLVDTGLSEIEAVDQYLTGIDTEIETLASRVEEAGGTVVRAPVIPTRDLDLSDIGINVRELTDDEYAEARELFRPERRAETAAEDRGRTIAGTEPDAAWAGETRISSPTGEPVALYRGATNPLQSDRFDLEALGQNTGFPASGLGVWLTTSAGEAAGYGPKVESFHLDIRNPKVYSIGREDLPDFDTVQDAHAFRESLRADGYDGIVIDLREIGKGQHVVAFTPEQVIRPGALELYQASTADITKTPEFSAWFGNSKVVDENGEPLVVYHGTGDLEDFVEFKPELTGQGLDQIGSGFYFTTDPDEASVYTTAVTAQAEPGATKLGGDTSPGILPVYVSIQNPINIKGSNLKDADIDLTAKQAEAIIRRSPRLMDMDETPLGDWHDVWSDGIQDWMISDVAKSYVGPSLMSLEGDFFGQEEESSIFRDAVRDATGHDGVIMDFGNGKKHFVAWFPSQIKSAIGNIGTFDPTDPRILYQTPTFYSAVEQAVEGIKQDKATPQQWKAMLTKTPGVKVEELEWLGIDDFLKGKKSVTKDDLLAHIARNRVEVSEVTLEDDDSLKYKVTSTGLTFGQMENFGPDEFATEEEAQAEVARREEVGGYHGYIPVSTGKTKFAQYTLPGGENYREVLFTLPERERIKELPKEYDVRENDDGTFTVFAKALNDPIVTRTTREEAISAAEPFLMEQGGVDDRSMAFRSSHFDQPNVLAHVRLNDRTGPNGERILFVEEIQSDWHQAGRKKGYGKLTSFAITDDEGNLLANYMSREEAEDALPALRERRPEAEIVETDEFIEGVPDAPLKKTWHEAVFRRATQMAVEGGYDSIAWTTGEQQAERYNLSRYVKLASLAKTRDGRFTLYLEGKDGHALFRNEAGFGEYGQKTIANENELEETIGKDPAEKLLKGVENKDVDEFFDIRDDDLKVGGEGMRGFYDKMLPAYAKKFGKKFGAGVGETEIVTSEGESITVPVWSLPITDTMRKSVRAGVPLFQPGPRASIQILDNERIIRLGQSSDLSSFLHESGHLFLEMEKQFAKEFGITEDQQTMLDWMGVESFDDVGVEQHEKFAETFESYLREGKAPSLKLREAFAAFRRWLVRIYQSIRQLTRADLVPEIAEVFDRMLATDTEIAAATANPAYDQFFRSKEQAGMTDAEWEQYTKQSQRAKNTTTATLDEKLFKELYNRRAKEWREEKRPLIEEEKANLSKTPIYSILNDAAEYPMDYDAVKEIMGFDKPPGKLIGKLKKDGIDPSEYAEVYGFNDAKSMINAITEAPTLKQAAEAAAEERMIQKHGDILNDGSIEDEVREAVHNEEQAKLLIQELTALKRKVGSRQDINRDYLKAEARTIIQGMKYKEIRPDKYYRAELRAAQKAVTAANDQELFAAKVQQIANHYLYREAVATREDMDKHRRYVRRVQTREYDAKQVKPEIIQNMKTLANLYDLKTQPEQQVAVDKILNWYMTQITDENQFVEITLLDPHLILALEARERGEFAQFHVPAFDELTAEQLRGMYDMLRHMRFVGGKMSDAAKAKRTAERMKLAESIREHGGKDALKARHPGVTRPGDIPRRELTYLINMLPSLRNLIRKLDGFKDDGEAYNKIFRVIEDANNHKLALTREVFERFEKEMDGIHKVGLDRNEVTYTLQSGEELILHAEARFMMAVYWGTESSREAIREGFGTTDADVMRILSDMTKEQLELVNAIWRVNESLWPELSKASVNLYGVAPPKLDPTPFEINGVKLTGGHMRLMYDSTRLELKNEQEQAAKMATIIPSKAGSLYSRVGSGGRPVRLDKNNIVNALSENVHVIAFAEPAAEIRAFLNADDVKGAIERKHGEGFYQALIDTVTGITSNHAEREKYKGLHSFFRLLRRAATFKHLAYSIRNTVQQVGALPVAMEEVGYGAWVNASMRFAANPAELSQFMRERSKFMDERASLVNREAHEYLRQISIDNRFQHIWHQFVKFGFTPQTITDSLVAYPTWLARYEQSMDQHGDEPRAISDADNAVAESVGAGDDLHLGGAFHSTNTEFIRTMTIFGTWFNAYYQRIYRSTKGGTDFFNQDAIKSVFVTPFIVAVLSAALVMDGPADDEEWYAWAMKRYAAFMAGTIPILRDVVSSFAGYAPKTVFAGGAEAPARLVSEAQAYAEGRQTGLKATSDVTKIVTTVVPVPGSGNVTRVMDYMDSYNRGREGKWNSYQAVVEGPDRNK